MKTLVAALLLCFASFQPVAGQTNQNDATLRWQRDVATQITRYVRYPEQAKAHRDQGLVVVRFVMDPRGRLISNSVERSSGHSALDQEALAAVRRAQPLPKPPLTMDHTVQFSLPINFALSPNPAAQAGRTPEKPQNDEAAKLEKQNAEKEKTKMEAAAFKEAVALAKEKGPQYAQESGTSWTLERKKNEMTDETELVVHSVQRNGLGATAEIVGACSGTHYVAFTAVVVDDKGKPTVNLDDYSPGEPFFGQTRINDGQPTADLLLIDTYRNRFRALTLRSATPEYETTWRYLVQVRTSAGDLLIKIPTYDPNVRELMDSCR